LIAVLAGEGEDAKAAGAAGKALPRAEGRGAGGSREGGSAEACRLLRRLQRAPRGRTRAGHQRPRARVSPPRWRGASRRKPASISRASPAAVRMDAWWRAMSKARSKARG
jgi:hypothetical protein